MIDSRTRVFPADISFDEEERAPVSLADHLEDDRYIRTAEAARILRVSTKTISRWAKDGKLPHVMTLGGHCRFPANSVHELARRLGLPGD